MKKKTFLTRAVMTLTVLLLSTTMWAGDVPYTTYTAISGTEGVNADEGYAALIDNDKNTKWCVKASGDSWTGTAYIEFKSDKPFIPTSYVLSTGNDSNTLNGRNPYKWTIKAKKNSSDNWTTIANVKNDNVMQDVNFTDYEFALMNTSVYQYFRFEITAVHSGNVFQLAEFHFIGHANNGKEATFTPPTAKDNLIYISKDLELIQPGSAVGGSMQYSVNNSDWSYNVPVKRDVGEYPIYYRVIGDDNHNNTVSYFLSTVSIQKADFVDISTIDYEYWATDGDVLTGTAHPDAHLLCGNGVTVTLKDVDITHLSDSHDWAAFCSAGSGTIILEGTNKLKGCPPKYPGLLVTRNDVMTIKGNGTLEVEAGGRAAGIGGGPSNRCGRIVIDGGTIIARGGEDSPGIGAGPGRDCKGIIINGGHVTAIGGKGGAGIGSGTNSSSCSYVTINGGTVIATRGENAECIGAGNGGTCGDITIAPNMSDVTEGDTRIITSTSGISVVKIDDTDTTWYDIKGQKLQSEPKQKGVYIHHRKKVIVK
ncbi:MAG: hypothetical protein IKX36_09805 [Prevotella sp.]|nr:hypothetical protein [Prevotella sp.]